MTPASPRVSGGVAAMELSIVKEMAMPGARVPGAVSLAWGLPSFRTPGHILAAMHAALDDDPDVGCYTLPDGIPERRAQVAERHAAETGISVDPGHHVIVTADNRQGMNVLLHEAGGVVTPGRGFGPTGEHHVRMVYCVDEDAVNAGFERIDALFGGEAGR